ncbi:Imm70 family immunity protein [Erwiniaceae bacterium CAU 1747]
MKIIGILGAAKIHGLGSPSDVELFFLVVSEKLKQGLWGTKYPMVMLRIYKKSLTF